VETDSGRSVQEVDFNAEVARRPQDHVTIFNVRRESIGVGLRDGDDDFGNPVILVPVRATSDVRYAEDERGPILGPLFRAFEPRSPESRGIRRCSMCGTEIRLQSLKCRYCGADLLAPALSRSLPESPVPPAQSKDRHSSPSGWIWLFQGLLGDPIAILGIVLALAAMTLPRFVNVRPAPFIFMAAIALLFGLLGILGTGLRGWGVLAVLLAGLQLVAYAAGVELLARSQPRPVVVPIPPPPGYGFTLLHPDPAPPLQYQSVRFRGHPEEVKLALPKVLDYYVTRLSRMGWVVVTAPALDADRDNSMHAALKPSSSANGLMIWAYEGGPGGIPPAGSSGLEAGTETLILQFTRLRCADLTRCAVVP
jgi:hypothetical protein